MTLEFYSDRQLAVLEALETYRFLTVKQMVRLGISKSETSLRDKILRPLKTRRSAPIKAYDLGRYQQLPHIFVLTAQGAKDLAEYRQVPVSEIKWPKGGAQFSRTFHHRIAQIDFHIAFRQWAREVGAEIEFVHMDFDKAGSQRQGGAIPLTRLPLSDGNYIISDGIFCFSLHGQRLLYCLEIHNETDTTRVVNQLLQYSDALQSQSIAKKFELKTQPIILSVLMRQPSEPQTTARKALERGIPTNFAPCFVFMDGFNGEISDGCNWRDPNGKSVIPFPV